MAGRAGGPLTGWPSHRMAEERTDDWAAALLFLFWSPPLSTFQKRSVSSAAAVQMVVPRVRARLRLRLGLG